MTVYPVELRGRAGDIRNPRIIGVELYDRQMAITYDLHQHDAAARLFRALAEPARLSLVHCLADGPHRVGELSAHLGLAQSTVSNHLSVLRRAGLVQSTPDGRATLYRLSNSALDELLRAGERLITPELGGTPLAPAPRDTGVPV